MNVSSREYDDTREKVKGKVQNLSYYTFKCIATENNVPIS